MATQEDLHRNRKSRAFRSPDTAASIEAEAAQNMDAPSLEDANPLSEREMEVSRLLVTGASNAEIARELVISPHTVKVHLRNVFEKLQVSSRTEATMVLLQRGWLAVPGLETPGPVSAPDAVIAAPPPEPQPLHDLAPSPATWQRIGLLIATMLSLLLLAAPAVLTRPKTTFALLSDAGLSTASQMAPEALSRWELRTPLTQARSRHAAALLNGEILVLGGEDSQGQALATADAYDLRFNSWRSLAPLPEPLANLTAAALGSRVYVAGGSAPVAGAEQEFAISDRVYALDPSQDAWQEIGLLPSPLAGAVMVSSGNSLYVLGGWDGTAMHDEVWRTQPGLEGSLRWELVTRLNTPSAFLGAAIGGNKLYAIGGYDGQRALAETAAFDLTASEWERLPPMSTARSGLTAVYDGMAVFALGGGWTKAVDTHERYDAFAGQWSNFPSPFRGEWRHLAAASQDGRIWLIGGWSGGYLDAHLEYQSAFRALLPMIRGD